MQQSSEATRQKISFYMCPSSLLPPRMGTLKGLCCTPHTVLDLQKRNCSELNKKKGRTGRDKLATFHKYNISLYAATSQVFAATPRNKHHCGPISTTPEPCQAEKHHLHPPTFWGHCQLRVPEPSCLILLFTLFMLIWRLL